MAEEIFGENGTEFLQTNDRYQPGDMRSSENSK